MFSPRVSEPFDHAAVQYGICVELLAHYICLRCRFLGIFRCPPVAQVTFSIVLAALVVEAVGHFVTDNRTDTAVVYRIISIEVEERELQDGSREYDFIPSGL